MYLRMTNVGSEGKLGSDNRLDRHTVAIFNPKHVRRDWNHNAKCRCSAAQ